MAGKLIPPKRGFGLGQIAQMLLKLPVAETALM